MENKSKVVKQLQNVTDFKKFKTFPSNRPVDGNQRKELGRSFIQYGTAATNIIVIKTKCFGTTEFYVGDGQHTIEALEDVNMGGNVTIIQLDDDTILNVTLFIAKLNNTNKGWGTSNYVNGFALPELKMKEYQMFKEIKEDSKLTITDLLFIYTGSGQMKEYKSGKLTFKNKKDSDVLLKCVIDLKGYLPNKAYIRRSLYKIMAIAKNYKKMTDAIIKHSKTLKDVGREFKENEAEFFTELEAIYRKTFKEELEMA